MRISGWTATFLYSVAAVVMTWPLARGLTHDIPGDLGDSLLNCWIVSWVADHLLRALGGDIAALGQFWHANIFYPEPYALAYSEHLTAQAVQILPVYAATHNPILAYNLLFLSTFVLSGLGMFLLVRSLTQDAIAGLVAGAIYAFGLPRVGQIPHLQVLSAQWMPFALLGLHRFFETRRLAPLVGAAAALIAQNLSCGYYLMFFMPVMGGVALFEIGTRRLWRDERMWKALFLAGAAVVLATLPFLMPYLKLRELGLEARARVEIGLFSADVYSYFTAPYMLRLWGDILRPYPVNEGELFPSWSALVLGAAGVWSAGVAVRRAPTDAPLPASRVGRRAAQGLLGMAVVYGTLIVLALLLGGFSAGVAPFELRVHNVPRLIFMLLLSLLGLWIVSPRAFERARTFGFRREALYTVMLVSTVLLSFGPIIKSRGRVVSDGPYDLLFTYVPGFDGLRVPARFGLLVCLFLSVLAGLGVASLRRKGGLAARCVPALAACFFVEAAFLPLPLNQVDDLENPFLNKPPMRIRVGDEIPDIYKAVQHLPASSVIAEFPFGEIAYELRYLYYSIFHWRPLVNGYSGAFPISYQIRSNTLVHPLFEPAPAWNTLLAAGATHAIVHRLAFQKDEGDRTAAWLRDRGAKVLSDTGEAVLFELPARPRQ